MSQTVKDHDRTIEAETAHNARWAAIDAQRRSQDAAAQHAGFFKDRDHQNKIGQVMDIVGDFFRVRRGIYVNHRENRGNPFTTVKVDNPVFPTVSRDRKEREYLAPLRNLGVEIVFSKRTNSYIYRIR